MKKLKIFIDNLPSDKKSHVVLGIIINPIVFICLSMFNPIIAFLICGLFHMFVEVYQKVTKKGQFEYLDALSGFSSAIMIYLTLLFY